MTASAFFFLRLNDHIQYLRKIQATLKDNGDFRGTDYHDCKLGSWLYGEGPAQAEAISPEVKALFDGLFEPHQQFHDASKNAVDQHDRGNGEDAEKSVTQMMQLSVKLVHMLTELDTLAARHVS